MRRHLFEPFETFRQLGRFECLHIGLNQFADLASVGGRDFAVRLIVSRVEKQDARRQELDEAARHPQQPNPLLLEPKLRAMLVAICGKMDFTPDDIEALEFSRARFFRAGLRSPDWRVLVKWMAMADKWPVAPHRMTVREWLEYETARLEKRQKEKAPRPEAERNGGRINP